MTVIHEEPMTIEQIRDIFGHGNQADEWMRRRLASIRHARLVTARAKGTHTKAQFQDMVDLFDGRCLKCGTEGVVKDHVVPISRDGCDCLANLQPLCRSCNAEKSDGIADYRSRSMPDWAVRLAEGAK